MTERSPSTSCTMSKIRCRFHEDQTASMELYADGYYFCFGCGAKGSIDSLGGNFIVPAPRQEREKENLEESINHIRNLPRASIRGLSLPTDGSSYYIVWPNGTYYNRRQFEGEPKYKCPSGHSKQMFVAKATGSGVLAIVEGEINAMSLALCNLGDISIVSPGGSGDFYSKHAEAEFYPAFKKYQKIFLFADEDKAGAIACIEFTSRMKSYVPDITICLLKKDFNDILVEEGVEALERFAKTKMDLP